MHKAIKSFKNYSGRRCFATNKEIIERDEQYVCKNYGPLPLAIERGERIFVWDVEGNKYFDMLAGFGACSQGHSHPKILKALVEQASKITLTARAMHNTQMGRFGELLHKATGYDKMIPCNGGVEADETACKMARRWGYRVKGIPSNKANLLFPTGNFWGRTITASGACDDPIRYTDFGPFTAGFELFEYNNVEALRTKLKNDPNICGVCIEPIQGENGVVLPADGYLTAVRKLCTEYNVLMISDEIQSGYGRTGKFWAADWENVRPDMITMGKSMTGGFIPASAVIADSFIMDQIKPGDHGSTYGGNPLAMAVAVASLQTMIEEGMVENAATVGPILQSEVAKINSPLMKEVRGRGLFIGIELKRGLNVDANDFSKILMKKGLLTKATHNIIVRLTPALVITKEECYQAAEIIRDAIKDLEKLNEQRANSKK